MFGACWDITGLVGDEMGDGRLRRVIFFFLRVILDCVKNLEPLSVQLYKVKKSD